MKTFLKATAIAVALGLSFFSTTAFAHEYGDGDRDYGSRHEHARYDRDRDSYRYYGRHERGRGEWRERRHHERDRDDGGWGDGRRSRDHDRRDWR